MLIYIQSSKYKKAVKKAYTYPDIQFNNTH
jgi:hypothetical protein